MSLTLASFDAAGLETEVLALIVAAAPPNVYADSNRGGTQSPEAGELGLGSGETLITRIRILSSGANILLNDNDVPAELTMRDYLGVGGPGRDLTLYIQTDAGVVSLPVATQLGNVGGGYANFSVPAADRTLINGIASGTRFIIALARPVTVLAGEVSSGTPTLTGDLTVGEASPTELAGEIRSGSPGLSGDLTVGAASPTELAGEIRSGAPTLSADLSAVDAGVIELAGEVRTGAPTLAGDLTVAEGVPTELAGEIHSADVVLTGDLSDVAPVPAAQEDNWVPTDLSGESLIGVRYRTRDGDSLDAICWKHYGRQAGAVEAVLEANPGLSEGGPVLPAGFVIGLPELHQAASEIETVSLWD